MVLPLIQVIVIFFNAAALSFVLIGGVGWLGGVGWFGWFGWFGGVGWFG